jgi:hypothetical protein
VRCYHEKYRLLMFESTSNRLKAELLRFSFLFFFSFRKWFLWTLSARCSLLTSRVLWILLRSVVVKTKKLFVLSETDRERQVPYPI